MADFLRRARAWLTPLWLHRWVYGWLRTYCLNCDSYGWRWRHSYRRGHRQCGGALIIDEIAGWADDGGGEPCTWCGGQPDEQVCDDPIQCCEPRCDGQFHPCTACQGTGLAKHQVIW